MIGKKRFLRRALKMAREQGYHNVKYICKWKGKFVYEPKFSDNEIHYVGIPQFILVDGEKMHWTESPEESFAIMQRND